MRKRTVKDMRKCGNEGSFASMLDGKLEISSSLIDHAVISRRFSSVCLERNRYSLRRIAPSKGKMAKDQVKQKNKGAPSIHNDIAPI